MFKLIISPEFGERVDLKRLTQQLVSKMEEDLDMSLEWLATIHSNTEHPHVHVAMRGVASGGKPLFLPRRYVQHGIRQQAEDLVTAQLGRRSNADIQESHRRETHQLRYTSLDQVIHRMNETRANNSLTSVPFVFDLSKFTTSIEPHYLKARLLFLEKMGLAEPRGSNQWSVHSDLPTLLRAMGEAKDRQRTLAAHRTVLSDTRLPVRVTDPATLQQSLEGRIIAHGEAETSGRTYMILEGTDHQIHFIYHTRDFDEARRYGRLKPNTFVRLTPESVQGKTMRAIEFGNAEMFLKNKLHFLTRAESLKNSGRTPSENQWSGWIGRYDAALSFAFGEIIQRGKKTHPERRQRGR
jgi:type IV secretory pathway VirD2 relaxase